MISKLILTAFLICVFPISVFSEDDEDNPHREMVDDQFVCLDCHTDVPKEGMTSLDYFLLDPPSETCLGCHDETEHPGAYKHLGKEAGNLPADENGEMACFTCHDPHPTGVIKGREAHNSEINKRSRDFVRIIVLPYIEKETGEDLELEHKEEVRLRQPVGGNELCANCHQDKNKKNFWKRITRGKFTELFSY